MNQFYSALTINAKKFPNVYQVFRPRYNKEYFKRLVKNLPAIESQLRQRYNEDPILSSHYKNLKELEADAVKLIQLRDSLERLERKSSPGEVHPDSDKLHEHIRAIEDRIHPVIVKLPNRLSRFVPKDDQIVELVESDFLKSQNLFKVLSHRKLSYINNCFSKSVVGPNSHYYYGIGAKLQAGLCNYFTENLEREDFILASGMCLTKSAVVEAANHGEVKDFSQDPARILENQDRYTGLHLVEASREALLSFIVTTEQSSSNRTFRLMSYGAAYRLGSRWFDSDQNNLSQYQTVFAMSRAPSVEKYSLDEYHSIRDIVWNLYKNLSLPCRLVHSSFSSMLANEYDSHRVEVWLPSQHSWIQVGRISHYLDYMTIRAGMKRGHIIDSLVFDGQTLMAAIVENRQTNLGKFLIPDAIERYMPRMSNEEKLAYFRSCDKKLYPGLKFPGMNPAATNYEQRRYLVKRNYAFAHSKKARRMQDGGAITRIFSTVALFGLIYVFIDIEELYVQAVPIAVQRLIYDKIILVSKRLWRELTYSRDEPRPHDPPFDEIYQDWLEGYKPESRKRDWYRSFDIEHSTTVTEGESNKP